LPAASQASVAARPATAAAVTPRQPRNPRRRRWARSPPRSRPRARRARARSAGGAIGASVPAALVAIARLREVGDQVGALGGILHAGVAHAGARHCLHGVPEEGVQRGGGPDDAGALQRRRVREPRHRAGATAKEPAVAGAGAIVGERVARDATAVDRLAALRVAVRRGRQREQATQQDPGRRTGIPPPCQPPRPRAWPARDVAPRRHDTNASGTGTSPRALRRIAQCIASSPRMLAAALARSRLSKIGTAPRYALTAPFSSPAANRRTSAWLFNDPVGKA